MFGNIVSAVGKNFLIANAVPACLFFLAHAAALKPTDLLSGYLAYIWSKMNSSPSDAAILLSISATLLLVTSFFAALLLDTFSVSITKLFEGYAGRKWKWTRWLLDYYKKRHQERYQRRQCEIGKMDQEREKLLAEHELTRQYPSSPGAILPTKLGNVMRASEDYPYKIWGIDSIHMWPRLIAVIPEGQTKLLLDAQTAFNFLLNISFLSTIFSLECLLWLGSLWVYPMPFIPQFPIRALLFAVSSAIIARWVYWGSLSSARWWGELIRTAFDLYRIDLLRQMKVNLPNQPVTFDEERVIWEFVQESTFYAGVPSEKLTLRLGKRE